MPDDIRCPGSSHARGPAALNTWPRLSGCLGTGCPSPPHHCQVAVPAVDDACIPVLPNQLTASRDPDGRQHGPEQGRVRGTRGDKRARRGPTCPSSPDLECSTDSTLALTTTPTHPHTSELASTWSPSRSSSALSPPSAAGSSDSEPAPTSTCTPLTPVTSVTSPDASSWTRSSR